MSSLTNQLFYTSTGISPDQVAPAIDNAGTRYNVPTYILSGVLQIESKNGLDMGPSSAGAIGPFQFLKSTAAQYGYPYTATPTYSQFQQQADAAAHYLSDLYQKTGSWDTALQDYSGGGYGLSQVQQASGTKLQANEAVAGGINIANPLSSVAAAISDVWNSAVGDAKYAGVLLVALGVAAYLIVHGVSGQSPQQAAQRIPVVVPA